jgi:hypothetical protein
MFAMMLSGTTTNSHLLINMVPHVDTLLGDLSRCTSSGCRQSLAADCWPRVPYPQLRHLVGGAHPGRVSICRLTAVRSGRCPDLPNSAAPGLASLTRQHATTTKKMTASGMSAPQTRAHAEMSTSFARIFIHELEGSLTFSRSC